MHTSFSISHCMAMIVLSLGLLFSPLLSHAAEIYTWTQDGVRYFSEFPPEDNEFRIYILGRPIIEYQSTIEPDDPIGGDSSRPSLQTAETDTLTSRPKINLSPDCKWIRQRIEGLTEDIARLRRLNPTVLARERHKHKVAELRLRKREYQKRLCPRIDW